MTPLLEAREISKSFSGQRALNGVSFSVREGEVHSVVGENGAGKSTLMKIIAGIHQPDSGELWLRGRTVRFTSTHAALKTGIAMIYQELLPFPELTVAENIFMGQEPARFGFVNKAALNRQAEALLAELNLPVSPRRKMHELRVAEMQGVEIAKALAHRARLIIMDEPTSALSEREAQALFATVRGLRKRGVAIIYISHKLDEIFQLSERVTVLRDGCVVTVENTGAISMDQLIALMAGRELNLRSVPRETSYGEVALTVRGLGKTGRFSGVSFEVRQGEILGLAGLMGAGRTDVVNALYGLDPADAGEVLVFGKPVRLSCPQDALRAEIGLVSEDRQLYGLVPTLGVKANMTLAALERFCRGGFLSARAERQAAGEKMAELSIKARGPNQLVQWLSGGNQQKVVLARMLLTRPQILLLDEPTRGIDVAAKAEVHALIRRFASEGKAVVVVSSEMPELLALSHRLLVLCQGRITAELSAGEARPDQVLSFAMPA